MKNKLVRIAFFLLVFLLLLQVFGAKTPDKNPGDEVWITSSAEFSIGKEVVVQLENRGDTLLAIPNRCPESPLSVERYSNGEWVKADQPLSDPAACKDLPAIEMKAKGKAKMAFGPWSKSIFNEIGKYRIGYTTTLDGKERTYVQEIEITPPSLFSKIWNAALYRPILNTLFYFIDVLPGHNLGWAILALTVLIKLILLVPNQRALKSQKALQKVQPQLDALKEKYKNDSQKLAEETMKIWKEHKVNPMGSCLPMLIQFPILIALFYVVRDGLSSFDANLLYAPLRDLDPKTVDTLFFGLELTKVNALALPIVIGLMQFVQIKLSFAKAKPQPQSQAAMMNGMMQYVLPVMIGVFSASLPAAVGFYWGVSTLFAVGQQIVVNRSQD